jgi:hypothetical protein
MRPTLIRGIAAAAGQLDATESAQAQVEGRPRCRLGLADVSQFGFALPRVS